VLKPKAPPAAAVYPHIYAYTFSITQIMHKIGIRLTGRGLVTVEIGNNACIIQDKRTLILALFYFSGKIRTTVFFES